MVARNFWTNQRAFLDENIAILDYFWLFHWKRGGTGSKNNSKLSFVDIRAYNWPVFQVLTASKALKAAIDHDSQASAQCFTFLHTVGHNASVSLTEKYWFKLTSSFVLAVAKNWPVWSQDNWAAVLNDIQNQIPQKATSMWIHPCGRLILNTGKNEKKHCDQSS